MEIKVIQVSKEQYQARGSYARYYLVNKKTGIKVYQCRGYKTIDALYNSQKWIDALTEFVFFTEAQNKTKMSPQNIKIVIAKKEKRFYPAIMMEHIEGVSYEDYIRIGMRLFVTPKGIVYPNKGKNTTELRSYVQNFLDQKAKITYLDDNYQNFIIEPSGTIRVIDFTPQLCRMEGLY